MADVSSEVTTAATTQRSSKKSVAKSVKPAVTAAQATEVLPQSFDLQDSQWYLNRELTWLEFNRRVLHEAEDSRNPLLERIKFLAIVNNNLDEFFMKRIGGLKQQIGAGVRERTIDGRTPEQQVSECYAVVRELEGKMQGLAKVLFERLAEHGIYLKAYRRLKAAQKKEIREYFLHNIFPLLTPLAMDPAHPFPFVSNLSLNLLAGVRYPDIDQGALTRIKVPVGAGVPRFLRLEENDGLYFVALEDVIANNLDLLFPSMVVESCEYFRVTRNANTELDEEQADDLLAMIETELRERRFAPVVRLQVQRGMDTVNRGMLAAELGLDEAADVFEAGGMLGLRDLFQFASLDRAELRYPPHHPIDHPKLVSMPNIFHVIREQGPMLLQHPYESFVTSVERFVKEASRDPKVVAIKMTIYRTSEDTKIIEYLIDAARHGKQVAVVVELKARFDESANIRWASHLEEAGIHVTYGVIGLKTHSKVIFVVRQDFNGLRRYAHIGTGNYHAGTARQYTDHGLLTCDPDIGSDLTELFNYLTTGYVPRRDYRKILPSPGVLKKTLLEKINREIKQHSAESPSLIQFKMNALEDVDITKALYRASQAGVKVDLIVRDTCRLRPGIAGLSDNVRVISIVGRFLEHTRIYYFRNSGNEEYFIGSADCMKRNLESRVEVVIPIEPTELQQELRQLLDVQLKNQRSVWQMQADGSYSRLQTKSGQNGRSARSVQDVMINLTERRRAESLRLKKRQPKGIARRLGEPFS